jgi:hypothetical protein
MVTAMSAPIALPDQFDFGSCKCFQHYVKRARLKEGERRTTVVRDLDDMTQHSDYVGLNHWSIQ